MGRALIAIACATAAFTNAAGGAPQKKSSFSAADFEQHIASLRERLGAKGLEGLSIRVEEPFVVIGNGGDEKLASDSRTVRWASDLLERDLFDKRPTKILDIYLFGDADSYEQGVKTLTGESPTTPYGFYSQAHEGLFMNIATGGGTLVHEIVHPFVEADFPNAPAWLNEGLGSLYEQSAERDGHIVGLTNWRLAGLQEALKRGVRSFEELTHLGADEFYDDDSGTNYAQSRYLFYYMQEKGLLRDFYHAFRAARDKDPSGYATLVATLGEKDMGAFQEGWGQFVAKLRFPERH